MDQSLDLSMVALLAILVIGFYVFVIRRSPTSPDPKHPKPIPEPKPRPTPNAPPRAFEPYVIGNGEWREKTIIDVRYRMHGCDGGGAPVLESGAYDPDNDLLEYWFEVTGPNKAGDEVRYSVYDEQGDRVDGRWLPREHFPVDYRDRRDPTSATEQEALVYFFVGHTEDDPPYPMVPSLRGCRPRPDPQPDNGDRKPLGTMRIIYKVRDPREKVAASGLEQTVYTAPC